MESLTLLRLLAVYVVLTSLDRLTGSGAIGALVNAFGVAIPAMMVVYFRVRGLPVVVPAGLGVAYGMLAAALVLSVLFAGLYNTADLIKFLLAPVFAILGYNASRFDPLDRPMIVQLRLVGAVLLLPALVALALNWVGTPDGQLGIFVNRNNAALYLVVLGNLMFLMGASVGVVVGVLTLSVLMFSTLGVVLAVIIALIISLNFTRYLPAYLLAVGVGAVLMFGPIELPIGERLVNLREAISAITALRLWTELDQLSYADLYIITGENTDLSLFFRLKHWQDLIFAWTSEGWKHVVFGLGIGSSPMHTDIGLVPHNDYVRFLVEAGPLGLAGFVSLVGWLLWSIGRSAFLISTLAVAIYFFTENLVDNFVSMTLFYWFAGYWARHASGAPAPAGAEPLQGPDAQGPGTGRPGSSSGLHASS